MTIRQILASLEYDKIIKIEFGMDGVIRGDALTLSIYLDDHTLDRLWDELTVVYSEDTTITARDEL